MSYDLINAIKIKDNKVFLKSASNNVRPRTFHEWECTSLTEILQKQGQSVLELEIFKDYEKGNFQAGAKNKYTRALEALRHMPEYIRFDWRADNTKYGTPEHTLARELRQSAEFDAVLKTALTTQLPKEKYVITKLANGQKAYFYHRRGASFCKWYYDQTRAKVFRFAADAQSTVKWFTNSENWQIEKL